MLATFGDYEILALLGRGGMGEVYRARQRSLDREVALKIIQVGEMDDSGLARFRREAKLASKIRHPSLVQVFDAGVVGDTPFITMELVEGHPLADLIVDGPVPWRRALDLVFQLAQALEHLHSCAILHRDIKPSNVLVSDTGDVKVIDFGLARRFNSTEITRSGVIVGSLHYLAPEILEGAPYSHASDLYAAGCVLYQLLTGCHPWVSDGQQRMLSEMFSRPPIPPTNLVPDIPPAVTALVMELLRLRPDERISSASLVASRIRQIGQSDERSERVAERANPTEVILPPVRAFPRKWRRTTWICGAGFLLLSTLAFVHRSPRSENRAALPAHVGTVISDNVQSEREGSRLADFGHQMVKFVDVHCLPMDDRVQICYRTIPVTPTEIRVHPLEEQGETLRCIPRPHARHLIRSAIQEVVTGLKPNTLYQVEVRCLQRGDGFGGLRFKTLPAAHGTTVRRILASAASLNDGKSSKAVDTILAIGACAPDVRFGPVLGTLASGAESPLFDEVCGSLARCRSIEGLDRVLERGSSRRGTIALLRALVETQHEASSALIRDQMTTLRDADDAELFSTIAAWSPQAGDAEKLATAIQNLPNACRLSTVQNLVQISPRRARVALGEMLAFNSAPDRTEYLICALAQLDPDRPVSPESELWMSAHTDVLSQFYGIVVRTLLQPKEMARRLAQADSASAPALQPVMLWARRTLGSSTFGSAVRRAISDPDARTRMATLTSLVPRLGGEFKAEIASRLRDENRYVRMIAAWVVGRCRIVDLTAQLVDMVARRKDDCGLAVWALAELKSPRLVEIVLPLIDGRSVPQDNVFEQMRLSLMVWALRGHREPRVVAAVEKLSLADSGHTLVHWACEVVRGSVPHATSDARMIFRFEPEHDLGMTVHAGDWLTFDQDGWIARPADARFRPTSRVGLMGLSTGQRVNFQPHGQRSACPAAASGPLIVNPWFPFTPTAFRPIGLPYPMLGWSLVHVTITPSGLERPPRH